MFWIKLVLVLPMHHVFCVILHENVDVFLFWANVKVAVKSGT